MGLVSAALGVFSLCFHYRKTKQKKWAVAGVVMIILGVMIATWDFFYQHALQHG